MFTAWRVSHAERREEWEAAGEDDDEEDDTPVVIPSSAVTTYPKGTPVPTPSIKVQVIEERVDLSSNLTWRQMIGVGVRRVVLARGELDKLEGPQYPARRGGTAPRGRRSRESKGPTGGGGAAERGRGERRDRGRSDKSENDEGRKTAGRHKGGSENRRQTAKRDS